MAVDLPEVELSDQAGVVLWRYEQARRYGLTKIEAWLFAESERDIGEMRHLADLGCPPEVAARILT